MEEGVCTVPMSFSNVLRVVGRKSTRKLLFFSILRILANGLDIVGVAGIALLASAFGAFTSNSGQAARISLPVVGATFISEVEAVLIALLVVLVFVLKSGFSILLNLKTALFTAKIESQLSKSLAEEFFRIGQTRNVGMTSVSDFQNLAIQSTSGIRGFLNARISFLSEGSLLISVLLVFFIVNPIAAIGLTVFMGSVLFILNRLISPKISQSGKRQVEGSLTALQSSRDLHGIKREAQAGGITRSWLRKFEEGRDRMAKAQALVYTLNSLPRFVIETALIIGIFLFLSGVVVFSDIQAQAATIGVFMAGGLRIIASIIPLQGAINGMRSGAATGQLALEALLDIKDGPAEEFLPKSPLSATSPEISFRKVSFSYPDADRRVVSEISFEVEPHTKVAIVGPSGAGKSTILDLAMGFLLPDKGQILIGGKSPREILVSQPGLFAVVPQRPALVSENLLENVSLVSPGDTDLERVKEVLVRSGLEKLTAIENWWLQEIKPDSGHLSGGEIQRLSLARALYRNPRILFLDEATSALDAETELEITRVLEKLRGEMTVLVIAHRLSTVKKADKLIYVNHGKIIAQGTFQELSERVKDFAKAIEILGLED